MWETIRRLFSKLNSRFKKNKIKSIVSCQEPSSFKGSKHSLQCHPHDAVLGNAHSFVSMCREARRRPCHSAAHCWQPLPLHSPLPSQSPSPSLWPSPSQLPLPSPIAIAVTIGHCPCRRHRHRHYHHHHRHRRTLPLLLPPPLFITAAISVSIAITIAVTVGHCRCHPLNLQSAISVSVAVGHRDHHCHWPSPWPPQLAIAENCCLGAARIIFEQFKQTLLTLFYFVRTVGGSQIAGDD
jgi:hypothetical protein